MVLAYALANKGSEVVLDDAAARRCTTSVSVTAVDTAGLVLRAKARGVIERASPLIEQLRGAGRYLADSAAARALSLVGE